MIKQDLVDIVSIVNANWPPPGDVDQKAQYEMWWRYLGDLDAEEVRKVVDQLVIESSQWRPKVGDIRKRSIDGDNSWPSPEEAWSIAEERRRQVDMGVEAPALDPELLAALREVMRGSRYRGKAGFLAEWQAVTARRYNLPSSVQQ